MELIAEKRELTTGRDKLNKIPQARGTRMSKGGITGREESDARKERAVQVEFRELMKKIEKNQERRTRALISI